MAPDPGALPPIRRSIVVPTSPDDAFRLWTDDIGAWWPLDPHSVHGAGGTVAFVDGELVERGPSGEQCSWGSVLAWEPGARVQLTWHPGRTADEATEVEVRFEAVDVAGGGRGHTLVTIEHRGWERHPDGSAARAEYGRGWIGVLGRFGDAARADDVWLVLAHTAGPAAPVDGPLFAHPDFAEHVAFLDRLAGLGVLVAAGPLSPIDDVPDGARGMTVVRVPAADVDRFADLARTDDQSVVRGLLDVTVSRWAVVRR
ncbi:MAG: SRPBCC domain-containing protein [Actinobacteria bacterium]|nr:SRPBCC domain-containing protein [Actinomycetota bacterium]